MSDDDDFGKIYTEVRAELQQRILVRDFKFSKQSLNRIKSGCLAKTSFKINKSLKFKELLPLTKAFTDILAKEENFALNKVSLIPRKKHNFDLLTRLDNAFISKLLNAHEDKENPDADLLHKDFVTYLEAYSYTLTINEEDIATFHDAPTLTEIIHKIESAKSLYTEDNAQFKYSVLQKTLVSKNEDGTVTTTGSVFQHLHGEITLDEKSYFRIDEEWYLVHPVFIKDLNFACKNIIDDCWNDNLIAEPFDTEEKEGTSISGLSTNPAGSS